MTQEKCSERADISIRYLQRIESGERIPSIETLAKLATTLKISIGSLIEEL